MESRRGNPEDNQLGPGVSEDELTKAIEVSGHPLQTQVAALLAPEFQLQHEWSYRRQPGFGASS
jgi:hypothetical protein